MLLLSYMDNWFLCISIYFVLRYFVHYIITKKCNGFSLLSQGMLSEAYVLFSEAFAILQQVCSLLVSLIMISLSSLLATVTNFR